MTLRKKWRARNPEKPEEFLAANCRHQLEFQRTRSMLTLLAAGWGAGKSIAGLLFIEWSLFMNPGQLGIIIEPDYKKVRDFINNKFKVAFRDYIISESVQDSMIYLEGGRRVLYMSGHKLEAMEQYQAAWLFGDEVGLMKADLLPRAAARVRAPDSPLRRIGFAGTPHWGWLADAFDGRDDEDRRIIHASTLDQPKADDKYIRSLYDTCSAAMADAYIHGRFCPPGGAIYGEYDPQIHLIDWTHKPGFETGVSVDWGSRTPHVLFFQIIPAGLTLSNGTTTTHESAVVFDEVILEGKSSRISTDDLCDAIVERGYKLGRACVDPTGFAQIEIAADRLGLAINFVRRSRRVKVTVGIEHVSRMLKPYQGAPLVYFSRNLSANKRPRSVLNAIKSYSYKKDEAGRPMSETPNQDGVSEHATSCLRYIAINYFPLVRYKGA